jgi:DNA-directed RNA polymerase specialized sigma24 family protein
MPVFEKRRLYDIKESAATLSISTKSVRNLVKRGLLKPNRALGKLLFSAVELDKFASQ